jgi:cytochrome P450
MQQISDRDAALAILTDPAFMVPPVPPASAGVAWLRATVARFSSGTVHQRRRALVIALLDAIPLESLQAPGEMHPVAILGRAIGAGEPVIDLVQDVAQAYQPGTGDESRADAAVDRLVALFGGTFDEPAAARIGLLVQACQPTAVLIERARHLPVHQVLRENPPVPATKRQALATTAVGDVTIKAGEVVQVCLADDLAFGAGSHQCPGRAHALALAGGVQAGGTP